MLHITTFMQNIAKLNKTPNCINSHPQNYLAKKNYSFIYDENLKKYDYHYNAEQDDYDNLEEGYWGYLRDKKADRKLTTSKETSIAENNLDGYFWGSFKDGSLSDECEKSELFSSRFDEKDSSLGDEVSEERTEKKLEYDYKSSKLKIQAKKRDEIKILMQSLEDKESQFKKDIIKSFDQKLESKCVLNNRETRTEHANLYYYPTKTKKINFLHFSLNNNENSQEKNVCENQTNFRTIYNTLSKLYKSINIFNGDLNNFTHANNNKHDLSFMTNVHASMNSLNGLLQNYFEPTSKTNASQKCVQPSSVSLISNVYETCFTRDLTNDLNNNAKSLRKNIRLFGDGNHATMLFEYQNVKIGFMGLIDDLVYEKLNRAIKSRLDDADLVEEKGVENPVEYVDFIIEADRLSKQLRQCGANIIVALTNMHAESNELKLLNEAQDLDIIFCSDSNNSASNDSIRKKQQVLNINNRWVIKSGANVDTISLVSLCLDELDSNKILDISIAKYHVE